ncbi:hypothetical protein [Endozoicomonas sp. 4G]|uniref:hypothetical protein n=1 Tax=Endozoicomonas sp. 4G TaxID=2872754 RepID=UPI0020787FD7|nr:hypothetical protein [Endozoicomonas sp. 4G]
MLVSLFCFLLQPSQLLAVICDRCGLDYDDGTFLSCPSPSCKTEAEDNPHQSETAPSPAIPALNTTM